MHCQYDRGRWDAVKARQKLKRKAGFTLAETLMTVLILLMVSTIVATGIPAARNAYEKVVLSANAQLLMSTTTAALRDELGTAWDISTKDNAATYFSADTGAKSMLQVKAVDGIDTIVIQEYLAMKDSVPETYNDEDGVSVGNERPLVSRQTAAGDLSTVYDSIVYAYDADNRTGKVTISNLQIKNGADVLVKLDKLEIPVIAPRPTPTP